MKKKQKHKIPKPQDIHIEELSQILEKVRGALSEEEHKKLHSAIDTLVFLTQEIEAKGASIQRLRGLLFGPRTEKTADVLGKNERKDEPARPSGSGAEDKAPGPPAAASPASKERGGGAEPPKRKGHGRNAAQDYLGAERVPVAHLLLQPKSRCPGCQTGKLYGQLAPSSLVRVKGMAPLVATVYELERLRCNLCGEVFTAPAPPQVGEAKYDETASAMLGLLRYGCGFPFHRLDWLEARLGIPLPATTQWELVSSAADLLGPAHAELIEQAAQGEVLHNDDTTMKILNLEAPAPGQPLDEETEERTGTFTTGIVSSHSGERIALFFTGRKHAGENLEAVLKHRVAEQAAAIQMCDALSRNTSGEFRTIVANCLAHARRRFVEVAENFPEECRQVLEALGKVYGFEEQTRSLSPQERLLFHQAQSAPVMTELKKWLDEQFSEKKVEPNSVLGKAINYMLKHWEKLTLFLRQAGAPLDNNICEQALKKAILHRKNSLFYKTQNGARVGDLFMSLIHTAELCGANPFDYLVELQRHHQELLAEPSAWMPWNYQQALERLRGGAAATRPP